MKLEFLYQLFIVSETLGTIILNLGAFKVVSVLHIIPTPILQTTHSLINHKIN